MFENLIEEKTDPIFSINQKFYEDSSKEKQNLSIGEYRDKNGNPYKLKILEKALSEYKPKSFSYSPLTGNQEFVNESIKLIFGKIEENICGFQTPSGTGAIFTMCTLLSKTTNPVVYCPNITWTNHYSIVKQTNLILKIYDYSSIISFDMNKFKLSLANAKENDIILFQACCHNPIGMDPTKEQWKEICSFIKKKKLIPAFDAAYYGFGDGLDEDLWSIRYFKDNIDEMFVCQSYSKIFGLYSERMGCLHIVCKKSFKKNQMNNILNVTAKYTRAVFGSCPKYFSEIIAYILKNYKKEFLNELESMRLRLIEMRKLFYNKLKQINSNLKIDSLLKSKGFFHSFEFNEKQISYLNEKHIYIVPPGRICICGINENNIDYLAEHFKNILKEEDLIKCNEKLNTPDLVILVTGAYGEISKCLYPLLLEKLKNLKIKLKILGNNKEKIEGIKMQIEDCMFRNLFSIEGYYNNDENAFKDVNLAIFLASAPYIKGCTRKDLFKSNKLILSTHSKLIEKFSKGCQILVVSNPVNSLASIVKKNAINSQVICLTSLDEYRGNKIYGDNVYIWGNHSNPQVSYNNGNFLNNKELKDRGNIKALLNQGPSTFSVSKAIADLIYNWYFGSCKIHSIGICDSGLYGIPKNLCFSMPVKFKGNFQIEAVNNIKINEKVLENSIKSINDEMYN